jgi:hypothetical protein
MSNQHQISLKFDGSKAPIEKPTFGLIRQVFSDLWSLGNPDFGCFLIISAML